MIVYDSNGQPYEADLVLGEQYRELEAERDRAQFWASAHKRRWSNQASELAALRAELTKAEARVGELEDACAELVTDANAVTLAANLALQSKRVKELETLLASEKATRNAIIAKGLAAEQRNAELEAEYRDLRVAYEQNASQCVKLTREPGLKIDTVEWLNGTAIQRERAEQAEARNAELAAALREAQHLVVAWESADGEPATELLRRIDAALARHAAGEPAKHPDTERLDWLERNSATLNFRDDMFACADYGSANHGWFESVRGAIDAARKEAGDGN